MRTLIFSVLFATISFAQLPWTPCVGFYADNETVADSGSHVQLDGWWHTTDPDAITARVEVYDITNDEWNEIYVDIVTRKDGRLYVNFVVPYYVNTREDMIMITIANGSGTTTDTWVMTGSWN